MARALRLGRRGRKFESCHLDQHPTANIVQVLCVVRNMADREEEALCTMLSMVTNLDINLVA